MSFVLINFIYGISFSIISSRLVSKPGFSGSFDPGEGRPQLLFRFRYFFHFDIFPSFDVFHLLRVFFICFSILAVRVRNVGDNTDARVS